MKSIELIKFLHPVKVQQEWNEWLEDAPVGFIVITHFDEVKGEIMGLEYNAATNNLEETAYTFDDYFLKKLKYYIAITADEITNQKLNPEYAETVLSNKLFNSTISRYKNKLIDRYEKLVDLGYHIPKALKRLDIFIHKHLSNQIIRPGKNSNKPPLRDSILKLESTKIDEAFLEQLFKWLSQHHKMSVSCEKDFILCFISQYKLDTTIKWNGSPQEIVALYYSLFNKIDDLGDTIFSSKPGYDKWLKCFTVTHEGKRVQNSKGLRKFNTNPKQGQFYKHLVNKILELTQNIPYAK